MQINSFQKFRDKLLENLQIEIDNYPEMELKEQKLGGVNGQQQ